MVGLDANILYALTTQYILESDSISWYYLTKQLSHVYNSLVTHKYWVNTLNKSMFEIINCLM